MPEIQIPPLLTPSATGRNRSEASSSRHSTTTVCFGFGESDSDAEMIEGLSYRAPQVAEEQLAGPSEDRRLSDTFEHNFDMIHARIFAVLEEVTEEMKAQDKPGPLATLKGNSTSRKRSCTRNKSMSLLEEVARGDGKPDVGVLTNGYPPGSQVETDEQFSHDFEACLLSTLLSVQEQLLDLQTENAQLRMQQHSATTGMELRDQNAENGQFERHCMESHTKNNDGIATLGAPRFGMQNGQVGEICVESDTAEQNNMESKGEAKSKEEITKRFLSKSASVPGIQEFNRELLVQMAKQIPMRVDSQDLNNEGGLVSKATSERRRSVAIGGTTGTDVMNMDTRWTLINRLDSQRMQLRTIRVEKRQLEDEVADLKAKLQKCEKIISRLTNELTEITRHGNSGATNLSEVPAAAQVWRPNAKRAFQAMARRRSAAEAEAAALVGEPETMKTPHADENETSAVGLRALQREQRRNTHLGMERRASYRSTVHGGSLAGERISSDAGIERRASNTGVDRRSPNATVERRPVPAVAAPTLVDRRSSTTGVERRSSTAGVEKRSSNAGVERRSSNVGVEKRSSNAASERRQSGPLCEVESASTKGRVDTNMEKWRNAARKEANMHDASSATSIMTTFRSAFTDFFGGLTSTTESAEASEPCPLIWSCEPLSENVIVSQDRRIASFCGDKGSKSSKKFLHAFVGTSEPAELEDGYGFELRVTKTKEGDDDGLGIGFTTTPPAEWPEELPETADGLPGGVWLVGYDGHFYSRRPEDNADAGVWKSGTTFNAQKLCEGDRVTLQVSFDGHFEVAVNEKLAWKCDVPKQSQPLYGVVDLVGNTQEVELIDEALVIENQ